MSSFKTNLKDNTEGLSKVEDIINDVKLIVDEIFNNSNKNKVHITLSEISICKNKLHLCLDQLAEFTEPIFDLRDIMERHYYKAYTNDENLGKMMWLNHYTELHIPFDIQKKKCFKLLDRIEIYITKINKTTKKGEMNLLKCLV